MLKIFIYDDLGNLELEGSTWTGQSMETHRESYLDWKYAQEDVVPRNSIYQTAIPTQAMYLNIGWSTDFLVPLRENAYSSLEQAFFSLNPSLIDWTGKIIRLEAEDVLQTMKLVRFYNIVTEPAHQAFRIPGWGDVEAAPSGYPGFHHTREYRTGSDDGVYECADFHLQIKSTRQVQIDCAEYEKEHGPIPKKLPKEFVPNLFP